MPKTKRRRKALTFWAIGLVLTALATVAIVRKHGPVITVQTEKVARRNITEIVTANGRIEPVLQVNISPEVSGEIVALPVKEGQQVKEGDLILKIMPDYYIAARNQAEANYKASLAGEATAEANLEKAEADFKRSQELFQAKLISASDFDQAKASHDVALDQVVSAQDQEAMSRASLTNAEVELAKTTIVSPLTGTVTKLDSQVGERVVGTATMAGTEVMTIADLNEIEARVDIGESDVNLVRVGQHARLEVDAFKDRKFDGTVTEIADAANNNDQPLNTSGNNQEATTFEVKIRLKQKADFRPGMSVTAEIEACSRTNVLSVPFACVTMRLPKSKHNPRAGKSVTRTNAVDSVTNRGPADSIAALAKPVKPIDVVFVVEQDQVKMVPVKPGIYDDSYYEIIQGLKGGEEVVSGSFQAINKELEDGMRIRKGPPLSGHS